MEVEETGLSVLPILMSTMSYLPIFELKFVRGGLSGGPIGLSGVNENKAFWGRVSTNENTMIEKYYQISCTLKELFGFFG